MAGYLDGKRIPDTSYEQIVRTAVVTGAAVHARPNSRYITAGSGATTVHLPDRPRHGQMVSVVCEKGGGWQVLLEEEKKVWYKGSEVDLNGRSPGRSADLVYLADEDRWVVVSLDALATSRGIYGVRIDTENQNPESAVEYTDDAAGFVPMRGNDGNFDWGSWQFPFEQLGIRPCTFRNGEVNYYLNPDDYNQTADGEDADITTGADGDVMIEFPKIYWKFSKIGDHRCVRMSQYPHEGFVCLAHTRGDVERDCIHFAAFHGWVDGNEKLRSLSGVIPTRSQTKDKFREYAHNNGSSGYEQMLFYQMLLLQVLYVIFFKSLDSQDALGRGVVDSGSVVATGSRNTDGMFYGVSTVGSNQMTKFCGIEEPWGTIRTWIDGLWSTEGTTPPRRLWIATDDFDTVPYYDDNGTWKDLDPRPDNYKEYGTGFNSNVDGYPKDIHGTNETGFVTAATGGSETTHYCDYAYLRAGCVGHYGGNYGDAGHAGAFYLLLNTAPALVNAAIGGRLTHIDKDDK